MIERNIPLPEDELGRIHARRWNHCLAKIVFELMALQDPRVNAILEARSACILTGSTVGLEYAPFDSQILSKELAEANAALKVSLPASVAPAKKKGRKR